MLFGNTKFLLINLTMSLRSKGVYSSPRTVIVGVPYQYKESNRGRLSGKQKIKV